MLLSLRVQGLDLELGFAGPCKPGAGTFRNTRATFEHSLTFRLKQGPSDQQKRLLARINRGRASHAQLSQAPLTDILDAAEKIG